MLHLDGVADWSLEEDSKYQPMGLPGPGGITISLINHQ
jgi:hypothetical protein